MGRPRAVRIVRTHHGPPQPRTHFFKARCHHVRGAMGKRTRLPVEPLDVRSPTPWVDCLQSRVPARVGLTCASFGRCRACGATSPSCTVTVGIYSLALIDHFPQAIRTRRAATRYAWLIASTVMVVLPTGVRPTSSGPLHRKCRDHKSRRGWKSRVSFAVFGSRPLKFGPLERLHLPQHKARLLKMVRPPCWRAMM